MWCLKCQNQDVDCTCDNTLERLQEKYEEGLGLLAQKNIRNRAIKTVTEPTNKKSVIK